MMKGPMMSIKDKKKKKQLTNGLCVNATPFLNTYQCCLIPPYISPCLAKPDSGETVADVSGAHYGPTPNTSHLYWICS